MVNFRPLVLYLSNRWNGFTVLTLDLGPSIQVQTRTVVVSYDAETFRFRFIVRVRILLFIVEEQGG